MADQSCLASITMEERAMEERSNWELVNPEGRVNIKPLNLNPHPKNLSGKTVLLRWNGKHNGDVFLNRVAELLTESVEGAKIIKSWEVAPETMATSSHPKTSQEFARKLADYNPDIVIGSHGD
jgi:hypothetical protein